MLEARHLAYFVVACQHLHLAKAAAEIDLAQSTLSMALKVLEEGIGTPLFAPAKVGVLPTPAALWLYRLSTAALHAESFARNYASAAQSAPPDHVVIDLRLVFSIGRFAKAVSCVIEDLQSSYPSTLFEPRWEPGGDADAASFLGRATTVVIDYASDPRQTCADVPIIDDPWVLARELPTSTIQEPSLDELLSGPIVVPKLHKALLAQAADYISRRRLPRARLLPVDPGALPRLAGEAPDTAFLVPRSVLSTRLGLLRFRALAVGDELVSRVVARIQGDAPAAAIFARDLRAHLDGPERNVIFAPRLTFRQLRYFQAIYGSRHLTSAARKANVAQPALSAQLLKTETALGVKLFERHRDGLVPTPAGARLSQAGEMLASAVRRIHTERADPGHPTNTIKIGVLPAIDHASRMLGTVAAALTHWRRLHPTLHLRVLEAPSGTLQEWLLEDAIGLAIVETELPQLPRFSLGPAEEMVAVADPRFGLLPGGTVSLADLARLPLVLPTSLFGTRQVVTTKAGELAIRIEPILEVNSLPLTVALMRENALVTVLPPTAVAGELAAGTLVQAAIRPAIQRRLHAVYSSSRPLHQPERDLIRLLREATGPEPDHP